MEKLATTGGWKKGEDRSGGNLHACERGRGRREKEDGLTFHARSNKREGRGKWAGLGDATSEEEKGEKRWDLDFLHNFIFKETWRDAKQTLAKKFRKGHGSPPPSKGAMRGWCTQKPSTRTRAERKEE